MFSASGGVEMGNVAVASVSGRGFTPEELAEQALDKIIYVGGNCHPAIREQAEAFKNQIRGVLVQYMHQAVKSNHTTLANQFRAAGHPELVKLLES
jgi:predicted phosphodiesterase